jgi:hypothetical protein
MFKKSFSDEAWDAVTAVMMIAVAVIGVVFWLYGLPS